MSGATEKQHLKQSVIGSINQVGISCHDFESWQDEADYIEKI